MTHKELLNVLADNEWACHLLWELKGINRSIGRERGNSVDGRKLLGETQINTHSVFEFNHTLDDSLENMEAQIATVLGIYGEVKHKTDRKELWDRFHSVSIVLVAPSSQAKRYVLYSGPECKEVRISQ